jgi:hypothetical protein
MGSGPIGALPPRFHDAAGIGQTEKPVLVDASVAHPPVEDLAVRVLDRPARIDQVQRHVWFVRPPIRHAADEFVAVDQHELHGQWLLTAEALQFPGPVFAGHITTHR